MERFFLLLPTFREMARSFVAAGDALRAVQRVSHGDLAEPYFVSCRAVTEAFHGFVVPEKDFSPFFPFRSGDFRINWQRAREGLSAHLSDGADGARHEPRLSTLIRLAKAREIDVGDVVREAARGLEKSKKQ